MAFRLGGRVDTHATGLAAANGVPAVTRWFYRQRMEAVLTRTQRPWVVLLDPGCVAPWTGTPGAAAVEEVRGGSARHADHGHRLQAPQADEQTIRPDAKLLLVAGAGWTKKQGDGAVHAAEAEQLILGFLRAAQASLGSSKILVDQSGEGQAVLSCLTHMNQIGQTGSTPRHAKGLSTCCHGEEPHVVGWRSSIERRADQSGRRLRLGARQGGRALCGGRLRGDARGERVAWVIRGTDGAGSVFPAKGVETHASRSADLSYPIL